MKAYRLTSAQHAEIVDVDVPEPGAGEVLLKVTGAGVCHSDLHILHTPGWPAIPMTLGHEAGGQIAEIGAGVSGWDVGDRVLVHPCWGCGHCYSCSEGRENYCELYKRDIVPGPGIGLDGAMAEYMVAKARYLVRLGDLDPVESAPLTDAALTPYHAINVARPKLVPTATAVVIGIGGLGHMAVQILAATTSTRIIAVDVDKSKLEHAKTLGADLVFPSDKSTTQAILDVTDGRGVEAVFDFVGAEPTLTLAAGVISPFGQIVVVGLATGAVPFVADGPPGGMPWGAGIIKPYGGTRADLRDVVALAQRGAIRVTAEKFPLANAGDVLEKLEAGKISGRAVLVPLWRRRRGRATCQTTDWSPKQTEKD